MVLKAIFVFRTWEQEEGSIKLNYYLLSNYVISPACFLGIFVTGDRGEVNLAPGEGRQFAMWCII